MHHSHFTSSGKESADMGKHSETEGRYYMNSMFLILLTLFASSEAWAHSGDFFINRPELFQLRREAQISQPFSASDDCKARIRSLICPVHGAPKANQIRECGSNVDMYAPALEAVYETLHPQMQKMFCSLQAIIVEENNGESLAYAGAHENSDKTLSAVLGIRAQLLTQDHIFSDVFSWKEQKAFGVSAPPFTRLPGSPLLEARFVGSQKVLQYVIIHEFGHIFDYVNKANDFVCKPGQTCPPEIGSEEDIKKLIPVPGSWSALSWENPIQPATQDYFPLHANLCFYGCNGKGLTLEQMPEFYRQLNGTHFITTYAAVSCMEDFAESTTFHFLSQQNDFQLHITDPLTTYFLERKWETMRDKRLWIENFYSKNLKYPETK
ncbi:hypothetical protein D3C87_111310 [compost metagenome]